MLPPGYSELRKIQETHQWVLYRASSSRGRGRRAFIKAAKPGPRREHGRGILQHQYERLRGLRLPGVARVLAFEEDFEEMPALVLEDSGRQTLEGELQSGPLSLERFLVLASSIATILGRLHARDIIHRDVNPTNIVLDDGRPTLVDFDLATSVAAQATGLLPELAGSLPYIAPEQTGRTDHLVDHRADLYSLGATFYRMLAGTPPFRVSDPIALVHAHLALPPLPLAEVDPAIPVPLSDIVLKLLAKAPEDRYQSTDALVADLAEIEARRASGASMDRFELGRIDLARLLPLTEHLYEREAEQAALAGALSRALGGARELVLVSGRAGVGKTAIVEDLHRRLGRATLISGKCDQIRTNVPYSALIGACGSYIQRVLEGPPEDVARWRRRLADVLGPNARLLTQIIAPLERLMGELAPVVDLGPVETENRFVLTFQALVRALSGPEHPLVLFLDDLQWADLGSLKLLRAIALDPRTSHLLFIGAFRDVRSEHPLVQEMAAVEEAGGSVLRIALGPLSLERVTDLVCDAVRSDRERGRALGALVAKKTGGNPFFVRRVLRHLQQAGMLVFDTRSGEWSWDMGRIEALGITENVVDLTVAAIAHLPPETGPILKVAACFGHETDLELLASVTELSLEEVGRWLWPAIRENLLVPVKRRTSVGTPLYAFVHDRVQQAVYSLLGDEEKQSTHLRIGRALASSAADPDDRLFEIVDQLDLGAAKLMTAHERIELSRQNERAGRMARASAAFDPGLRYARKAIELLGSEGFAEAPDLAFRVHRDGAECAFFSGDEALAEELVEAALANVANPEKRAELYALRVEAYSTRGAFDEAVRAARTGLAVVGIELPENEDLAVAAEAEFAAIGREVARRSMDEILALPDASEHSLLVAMRLLAGVGPSGWFISRPLLRTAVTKCARLSLVHGHSHATVTAWVAYAIFLAQDGNYDEAYRIGRMALALGRRFGNPSIDASTLFLYASFVQHWREPLSAAAATLRTGLSRGLESGALLYAAFSQSNLVQLRYTMAADLDRVQSEIEASFELTRANAAITEGSAVYRQVARCLRGRTSAVSSLDDDQFDSEAILRTGNPALIGLLHIRQLELAYLLRDEERALAALEASPEAASYWNGHFAEVAYVFYGALVLAAHGDLDGAKERERKLAIWAEGCPANYLHKLLLVRAEIAYAEGRVLDAIPLYERAIVDAAREGALREEALAHERCGRLFQAIGAESSAIGYLRAARDRYSRWGATAKVRQLEEELPGIATARTFTTLQQDSAVIDLLAMLKALENLSSELVLGRLLERLLEVCMQVAGAERGALVLVEDAGLVVTARASASGSVSLERFALEQSEDLPKSVVAHVNETGQILVLADASRTGPFTTDPFIAAHGIRSVLGMPIVRHGRRAGVLYLDHALLAHAFTHERTQILHLLSAQIAIALENSLLFEKLTIEVKDRTRAEAAMRYLAEASRTLAESIDYATTLARVARLAIPTFADWCLVDVLDDLGGLHRLGAAHVDPKKEPLLASLLDRYPPSLISPHPAAQVLRDGRPILRSHSTEATLRELLLDEGHFELITALGVRSYIVVPMLARGRTIGAITFVSSAPERRYDQADLVFAEDLALRAALAIDNARLYAEARQAILVRDDFLQVASHELRTPLTSLQLSLEWLVQGRSLSPAGVNRAATIATEQTRRLALLVDELLDVSRLDAGGLRPERESVDLAELVRKVAGRSTTKGPRGQSELVVRADPVIGEWDRSQLERVVENLLGNAVKFGDGKPIEIAVERAGDVARLTVSDHGIGIGEEHLPRVFDRFHRAVSARHYGGLGLGLHVVKTLVEGHGGTVRVESTEGEGTRFVVELPLVVVGS